MLGCVNVVGWVILGSSVSFILYSNQFDFVIRFLEIWEGRKGYVLGEVEGLLGHGHGAIVKEENVEVDPAECTLERECLLNLNRVSLIIISSLGDFLSNVNDLFILFL